MDLKLPFGLKNGQLVHVSNVESGLECECSCPACGHPLVAKKGRIRSQHFAHYKSPECAHGYETAIHLAAKKIIEKAGYIRLPKFECEIINTRKKVFSEQTVHFDKIDLEPKDDDIIPDILLEKDGRRLCIEIYVTHKLDEQKIKKLRERNLSTIEIDLSEINRDIDFESLREMVVDSIENKKWIFNLRRRELHNKILKHSIGKMWIAHGLVGSHVDDCPKPDIRGWNGKPSANVRDDCYYCEYFVKPESHYRDDRERNNIHEEGTVYCIGHKTEEEINDLLGLP